MSASRSITVVPPGRGFSASLPIASSICRSRMASPSSVPRMCSTSGISADQRVRRRILEAHAAAREHRARAVAAVAQQHRLPSDRLVGQLVDVHDRRTPGPLDTECSTPGATSRKSPRPEPGRLGAGTLQPRLAVGDEVEDGVVLRRAVPSPHGAVSSLWQ